MAVPKNRNSTKDIRKKNKLRRKLNHFQKIRYTVKLLKFRRF